MRINNIKKLTKLEVDLCFKERTKKNKDILVCNFLYLVYSEAKKYHNPYMEYNDFVQEGTLGLIKAVELFNPNIGILFETYAKYWINSFIKRAISQKYLEIRLPANLYTELINYNKGLSKDISDNLKKNLDYCNSLKFLSLEAAKDVYEKVDIDQQLDNAKLLRKVEQATSKLTIFEQAIFTLRFYREWSMKRIAEEFNVSVKTISRYIKKIQNKLRGLTGYVQD